MNMTRTVKCCVCIVAIISVHLLHLAASMSWLAMKNFDPHFLNNSAVCKHLKKDVDLVRRQARLCRLYPEFMPLVAEAAQETAVNCKKVFRDEVWNCSSIEAAPEFAADLTKGTKEQAFVQALSAAAIAHKISRACASGALDTCRCGKLPEDPANGAFKWEGCSDNVREGVRFSRKFADASYKVKPNRRSPAAIASIHNNRAGRRTVKSSLVTQCKCHGLSGSCNMKTCWKGLPSLGEISEKIKRKYDKATEVVETRTGRSRRRLLTPVTVKEVVDEVHNNRPGRRREVIDEIYNKPERRREVTGDDLIFVAKSPDYCEFDAVTGSFGTTGRQCVLNSTAPNSCSTLCCNRGYNTYTIERVERCRCRYHWCCYVECDTCHRRIDIHECL